MWNNQKQQKVVFHYVHKNNLIWSHKEVKLFLNENMHYDNKLEQL